MAIGAKTVNKILKDMLDTGESLTVKEIAYRHLLSESAVRQTLSTCIATGTIIRLGGFPVRYKATANRISEGVQIIREAIPDPALSANMQESVKKILDKDLNFPAKPKDIIYMFIANIRDAYGENAYSAIADNLINIAAVLRDRSPEYKAQKQQQQLTPEDFDFKPRRKKKAS